MTFKQTASALCADGCALAGSPTTPLKGSETFNRADRKCGVLQGVWRRRESNPRSRHIAPLLCDGRLTNHTAQPGGAA